jgi:glycosyltransferase involved in cell wall biosynthesis
MPLRALIVSYVFPPTGGAGVGRVLKLAKYLPAHDVTPAVLTVANPSVPITDHSLEKDVSPDLEVVRARTLEPGYRVKQAAWASSSEAGARVSPGGSSSPSSRPLARRALARAAALGKRAMVPDPQVLWQPDAQRILASRLARRADDVVFISAPPFSTFLSAPLARLGGAAVVLDYRDEWSTLRTSYEMLAGRLAARLGGAMEVALIRSAHAVTTATEAFRRNLLERFSFLDPDAVVAIPNGYDPDDFPAVLPSPPGDRFVVTYAGTIFKLTSPRGLLGAIRRLHEREPELARLLQVRFLGRIVETELEAFVGMDALGVCREGYVDKDRVILELAASHLVLCLLDDVPGVDRIYPAKIFELMHLGRPCLTLSPRGALADLVDRHRLGVVLPPRNEEVIAAFLERELRAFKAGSRPLAARGVDLESYDRRVQAGEFAGVFREAVARARS